MDKPGPHGGEIRMPAAFHTEAVIRSSSEIAVYLLDMDFQLPETKKSKVDVVVRPGKKEGYPVCRVEKDHFSCHLPKGEELGKGDLIVIRANRDDATGVAIYQHPLKFNILK